VGSTACVLALFGPTTPSRLTAVTVVASERLPLARSALARRLRGLTVWSEDEGISRRALRQAWTALVQAGPPPTRLHLGCHDPGEEGFDLWREQRWLRRLRWLTIQNDSQSDGLFRLKTVWGLLRS